METNKQKFIKVVEAIISFGLFMLRVVWTGFLVGCMHHFYQDQSWGWFYFTTGVLITYLVDQIYVESPKQ